MLFKIADNHDMAIYEDQIAYLKRLLVGYILEVDAYRSRVLVIVW